MVFAARVAEGVKGSEDCSALDVSRKKALDDYIERFQLDT